MNRRARGTDRKPLNSPVRPDPVGRAVIRDLIVVPSWAPVGPLVAGPRVRGRYPVVDPLGALVGMLDLASLAGRPDLHDRLAGEACLALDQPHDPSLVVESGRLLGVLAGLRPAS